MQKSLEILLATTTAITLAAGAGPALSQTAKPASSEGVEEIVVTAQKKSENLQKAPLAVDAVPATELAVRGVLDLRDVQKLIPSVRLQLEEVVTEIYIRGVGGSNNIAMIDPANAFNFNGAYLQREATGQSLYDIAQIEVVPGPQNTLYGRSALGGAVNVTSKRPTSNYQGSVAVEYGNYDYTHATLVGNVPVTDDFWIRLAVNKLSHSGFETTGADSRDEYGARLSMLYTPSDALTAYLWMNFDSQQGHPENGVNKGLDPATLTLNNDKFFKSNPWNDTLPAQYEIFGPITAGERHYQEGTISGQIDYKFDDLTLTYIPSYTRLDSGDTFFLTALPFNYQNTSINYSNELRLTNDTDGAWKWLTGLYEYGFDAASPSFLANEGDVDNHVHSSLYGAALFGQSTYSITDSFRATAGGRLSFDHRDVSAIDPVAGPFQNSHSFRSADWKIGTDYNVTDKSLLYANIQTGDQVGTFNVFKSTPTIDNFVKSPHILSFSVGSKNRFLDDRLEIDDEVYHYIYKNLIVSAFDAQVGGRNFNAQRVLMWGNELSAKYYITPADKLDISVGYLNARNDKFITPFPVNGQTNFDGLAPAYAPDWTVSAGFEHIFDLDSGASVVARVDTYFESEFAGDFIHSVGGVQAAYTKTDVSVTYNSPDGQWNVGIWAKNLENAAVEGATATGGSPGPVITFPQDPRTFGVRGSIAFGK